MKYVLITPAHNEEAFIPKTLASMVAQTVPPERWVIVDDGSMDRTPEIVEEYATRFPWIELVRYHERQDRNFASKAHAVNAALERVQSLEFEIVGNLDADVSFAPDYMEFLMRKFREDPDLGVSGTPFTQDGGYDSSKDSFEGENYVAGPCQLFRRECFQDIGGYVPNRAGGVDWIAAMTRQAVAARLPVVIASSDKDFMQLVCAGQVGLLNPNDKSERIWTDEDVRLKAGVQPGQIVDWLSLIGDSVDNIPGVPGVGILSDSMSFIWAEMMVSISAIALAWTWIVRSRKDKEVS